MVVAVCGAIVVDVQVGDVGPVDVGKVLVLIVVEGPQHANVG